MYVGRACVLGAGLLLCANNPHMHAYEMNARKPGSQPEIDVDARCRWPRIRAPEKSERVTNFAYLLIHAVAGIFLHSFRFPRIELAETASPWEH